MIDLAFLRPGRFDHIVYVGLPDTEDRSSILRLLLEKMKTGSADIEKLGEWLANATDGYSGADLAALCREAAVQCVLAKDTYVEQKHFDKVFEYGSKPSTNRETLERLEKWKPRT